MTFAPDATPILLPVSETGGNGGAGDERFRWDLLVSRILHPAQVAAIEAFLWVGRPLSPSELAAIFEEHWSIPVLGYHTQALIKLGVLEMVDTEPVRGAMKHIYVLSPELVWR
jgi:hypothetical protein